MLFVGMGHVYGQASDSSCNSERIDLYPIAERDLQGTIECNVSTFLVALDNDIPTITFRSVPDNLIEEYRTRRRHYNALLIPNPDRSGYQIRGLHLISKNDNIDRLPQLVLNFDLDGKIVGAEVSTLADRERDRVALRAELVDAQEREVLRRIERLERAYNQPTASIARDSLIVALDDAAIVFTLLQNGEDLARSRGAAKYAQNVQSLINRWKGLEVTYELINIYRALEENDGKGNDSKFHVTLVQHWHFPQPGYADTDYIAIEVDLDEPAIEQRRGGRDTYVFTTTPPDVDIETIDEIESPLKTNFNSRNTALQYHYVWVNDPWFKRDYKAAVPAQDRQRLVEDSLYLNLEHVDARVKVNVLREDGGDVSGTQLSVFGAPVSGFQSGDSVNVRADDLIGTVPGYDGTSYPGLTRDAKFYATLENYEPADITKTLSNPHGEYVDIVLERKKGLLEISSMPPEVSQYTIDLDAPQMITTGSTPATTELEVTGDRNPYVVTVRNEERHADTAPHQSLSEQNAIVYFPHREGVVIREGETSRVQAELTPLHLHHQTDKGRLDTGELDWTEEELTVRYNIVDHDEKNRKYNVSFEIQQGEQTLYSVPASEVVCANTTGSESAACLGKRLRPGEKAFNWSYANAALTQLPGYDASLPLTPTLTLKKKPLSCGWPCIMVLPVAAGVASAFIWPRTGSGGDDNSFVPPPRPSENQNR